MFLIPFSDVVDSARCFETSDLKVVIKATRDQLLDDHETLGMQMLAKYGLALSHELRVRTDRTLVEQNFWMTRFGGDPQWPDFMINYYTRHRALLVLRGWTTYLVNKGVDHQRLVDVIRGTKDSAELEHEFLKMIKPDDGSARPYHQFEEKPAAYQLWPTKS